nr:unnamed protein product [Callosobruchus analis]
MYKNSTLNDLHKVRTIKGRKPKFLVERYPKMFLFDCSSHDTFHMVISRTALAICVANIQKKTMS